MIICICYFKYLKDKNLLIDGIHGKRGGEMENNQLFLNEKITEHITRIIGVSGEIMYLIKGSKKSILVDCGVGIGHLQSYIKENMGMDVDSVLLTHGHIDHIGGAGEFEHVYLNPLDFELAQVHYTREKQIAHLNMCGIDSRKFAQEDYCSFDRIFFEEIKPGEKIDLGDITLSILTGKGHTQGQITVLIPEEKYFILGDACNNFVFLFLEESSSVVEYKRMLEELKNETEGKYDHVLVCHGSGYEDREIITEVINVCQDIIERNSDDVPFSLFGQQGYIAKKIKEGEQRVDGKSGNIVYSIIE